MGGAMCKEEVKEERRSLREENLSSADRIRKIIVTQSGFNSLSLARRGLKVGGRGGEGCGLLTHQLLCVCMCMCVQEVPVELWELQELQKLNLSLNSLKVLQPGLALLSNLVVLNLWGNQVPEQTH